MKKILSENEMRELIIKEAAKLGSQKDFAKKCGVSDGYVSDVLKNRRDITDKISEPLGYKRKVVFEKIAEK